ncbi:hypothetical protein [Arthrobacter sp. NicSoilB8]|uniref:hypothetical protein n=1 Tax=Arthrobacter sp. NicSoilB8 TaxID=2830998 RepID=UPI001CC5C789|nr:hypothetical protein [Arthrobacter sp. NicSoilB8]BCW72431.1 hypothetical protein NicSoilB8_34750 [Arthrobacter sp. NicSoilB8]
MDSPQTPEAQLESLAPHVAQHESELEQLKAQLDALARSLNPDRAVHSDEPVQKEPPDEASLRAEQERLERSLSIHQRLIELGRDHRVGVVLSEVAADRELARSAATDPFRFAAARGIDLPEKMRLDLLVNEQSMFLQITHFDEDAPFILIWTPDGFQPPEESPNPTAVPAHDQQTRGRRQA